MTINRFLNQILRPFDVQFCRMTKYRPVFGLDWIDDANDILKARGAKPAIVMDIGANRGQTSKRLSRGFSGAQVHCYEPNPASHAVLKENLARFSNAQAHLLAFGPQRQMGRFYLRAHHEESSFLNLEAAEAAGTESVDIEMRALDEYVAEKGWDAVNVLKINAEGYDLAVLRGGRGLLDSGRIHLIFTEMLFRSQYTGQGSYMDTLAFLTECGYSLVGFYETASTPTGESLWSNGLFVKIQDQSVR
jgi:FkbM family methyltransferase